MKKTTKSVQIRKAINEGKTPRTIAKELKVPVNTVYTLRWKMNKEVKQDGVKVSPMKILSTPNADFVRDELANIERQIDNLNTIASFLAIRLRQLEQNGE
jgi:hypothetical protein